MGCDTMVALAPTTRDGATLFAKNSDRPPRECQRLVQHPRRRHAPGGRVRCQYVEVAEARETAAWIGSQPHWLWGVEHGVNEHRVAIGNETVFTREPLGKTGLLGMDCVRLGLERGRTAAEALGIIADLLETHGQGGSGFAHVELPYHNAFLIADPDEAWILESSDRHWAARRVDGVGNVSNGLAIGAAWDRTSPGLTTFAVEQGWWSAGAGPVDFTAAFADETGVPPNLAHARRRRAAELLEAHRGGVTEAVLRTILRDHYEGGATHTSRPFDDPHFFSLCMHADPLDNTTASIVARLPSDPDAIATVWLCLGSPCVGAYLPCYLDGVLPATLGRGGADPDPESPWWGMRELLTLVEADFARLAPPVRAGWDAFEAAVVEEAAAVEAEARRVREGGAAEDAATILTAFMDRTARAYGRRASELVREVGASGRPPGRA